MGRPVGSKNKTEEIVEAQIEKEMKPVKVRKYSDNKDHKGEGEPLCLNCEHRQDMHHLWNYHEKTVVGKTLGGEMLTQEVKWKTVKIEDGNRPCQHACLCKNYE